MSKAKFIKDLQTAPPDAGKIRRAQTELVKRKTPIVIITLTDAKILLSRIILNLQQETIETSKAKSIIYAVSIYISCYKEVDFEKRLEELEKKLQII